MALVKDLAECLPQSALCYARSPLEQATRVSAATPRTALISSPSRGVFDVASVCFLLRRGRVISSGVFDVADVADADPEMNGWGVRRWRRDGRSLRARHRTSARCRSGGPGITPGLERDEWRGTLRRLRA